MAPKNKPRVGGRRPGAGRKPRDETGARIPVCVRLPRDVVDYLAMCGTTATIERAIRDSTAFREWLAARGLI